MYIYQSAYHFATYTTEIKKSMKKITILMKEENFLAYSNFCPPAVITQYFCNYSCKKASLVQTDQINCITLNII